VDSVRSEVTIRGMVSAMEEDIPPLRRPEDMPPVCTQADLYQHWRALMGDLGFGDTLLWFQFFEADGRCAPMIQQVGELPDLPDPELLGNLMHVCARVVREIVPDGSVAFLRSRPGGAGVTASDRSWATRLAAAAREAGVNSHPVHLANDEELRVFAPDDEIASA
jgi:hypothetical protein